mmetsp:Transcript_8161/g.17866  ORF Transcript_8161/g.17866 Transcript_8161/m.17866 type:complete len:89 (+) Transcript_8161:347-613(+)|eukprot:6209620-Pleurochrysis_carterae.AAC.2
MARQIRPPPPPRENFTVQQNTKARKETGKHNAKLKLAEAKAVQDRAVARRQPFPLRAIIIGISIFAAISVVLYLYLSSVVEEDDELGE